MNQRRFQGLFLTTVLLTCISISPHGVWAQESETTDVTTRRISIDEEAPLLSLLQEMARQASLRLEIDTEQISGTTYLRVNDATLQQSLDIFCAEYRCQWHVSGETLLVRAIDEQEIAPPKPLDRKVRFCCGAIEGQRLLERLADFIEARLEVDGAFTESVPIGQEAPVRQHLRNACKVLQCTWRLETNEGAAVLRIAQLDEQK